MCGRYYFDIDEKELKEIVEEAQKNIDVDFTAGQIFPTNVAPIITGQGVMFAKWGFPKWDGKSVVINARAEGLTEKRMFKNLVTSNRCIVPASAYFEWKKASDDGKIKDKYMIRKPDSILYMAGLYNIFEDKHSNEQLSLFSKPLSNMLQYTIITKDANESVSFVHDRMPLIFNKEEMYAWLHGENLNNLLHSNNITLECSIS